MIIGKKEIDEIRDFLLQSQISFGYMFGSQISGRADKESDVDLAVMFHEKDPRVRFEKRLRMIGQIGRILKNDRVDLVALNDKLSIFFKFVIVNEGRVICDKDHSARVDFELRVVNEYYDELPFLKLYNQAFLERAAKL